MSKSRKRNEELIFQEGRRRFLRNSASAATGAAIAIASGPKSWYAWADTLQEQKFMINIHLIGGWDTNWFHTAFPKSKITLLEDNPNQAADLTSALYDPRYAAPPAGVDPFMRKIALNESGTQISQYFQNLYTERTKSDLLVQHALNSNHYFGVGAQNAFNNNLGLLMNKACIWKGIDSKGSHSIPNKNILHGNESSYAIPYSGLISEALATRQQRRKLHYVQLTSSPTEYGANWAMSKGDQVPINCPDHESFKKLITRSTHDISDAAAYSSVNEAVKRLGDQIGKERFSLSRSKEIYADFVRAFTGAIEISQMGSAGNNFEARWVAYANYALERMHDMHSSQFLNKVSPDIAVPFSGQGYNTHTYAPFIPSFRPRGSTVSSGTVPPTSGGMYDSEITAFRSRSSSAFNIAELANSSIPDSTKNALDPPNLRWFIGQCAWKFAMAEYLITEGHSTVVDLSFGTGDAHKDNPTELRMISLIYSLYAKLLSELNDKTLPGTGRTYLDRTLVVMFSEFDRTAKLDSGTSPDLRGTEHDTTTSILLAGYGVRPGVVGDRLYGNLTGPKALEYKPGTTKVVDYKYVFPTLVKIFGVEVPANQITDADAVTAVIV